MYKKNKIRSKLGLLSFLMIFFALFALAPNIAIANPEEEPALVFGTYIGPSNLDPLLAFETNSFSVIDQVVEGLFAYDLSHPEMVVIPRLAAGYGTWSPDGLTYTVSLKPGVTFHDGALFNATAVEWNYNRLAYFTNFTGLLPPGYQTTPFEWLYRWPDGTPIINRVESINIYTVDFILNRPYAPFESLLAFTGSAILSPKSTPYFDYLNVYSSNLIGTGPFVYDYYSEGFEVKFHAYENYHSGEAEIKDLTFSIIGDSFERSQALLDGLIDILHNPELSMISTFEADPQIVVEQGQDEITRFITMNNQIIDQTWRQAISYAFDYNYYIDDILGGEAIRLKSPIPEGILYANWSFNAPTHSVIQARQILVDAGICNFDIYSDTEWLDAAANNPLKTITHTYIPSVVRENIGILLEQNLELIGIDVILELIDVSEFLYRLYEDPSLFQTCYLGWGADYNDPSDFINYLYSVDGTSNFGLVDDPTLEDLMAQGLSELDPIAREGIYDEIQRYMVEELMPFVYLSVSKKYDVYNTNVFGYNANPMGKFWFYDITLEDFTPPETFVETQGVKGFDGYYMSDVRVYLYADDDMSGVLKTEYSFDGAIWNEYFDSIEITNYGATDIYYRSVDYAGNIEPTKLITIEIYERPPDHQPVIYAPSSFSYEIDPHYVWEASSYAVIDQVVETLFAHDFDTPDNAIVPRLAADYGTWSPDGLSYTVPLRTGVYFHDGAYFDAYMAEWSFNRLFYFMNMTGTLPSDQRVSMFESMFRWFDGTPIIDHVEVVDPYTLRFVLNRPYAGLEGLLAMSGTAILSAASTPATEYLNPENNNLVGTGPFRFAEYQWDTGVRFYRFDPYWQGPAMIDELWFLRIDDSSQRQDAFQRGVVDFLDDPDIALLDDYIADPNFVIEGGPNAVIYYIAMRNNIIDQTIRQAISYAINYTHLTEVIYGGHVARLRSPIPLGIPYANWGYNAATFDVLTARQILVDAGVCSYDIYDEQQWIDNPILSYNYDYLAYSSRSIDIALLVEQNLEKIGIDITLVPTEWSELLDKIFGNSADLHLFLSAWGADFIDPYTFINSLLSNDSPYNWANVDDPYLQNLIDQGISETDKVARQAIYDEIQRYCVEELMPWVFTTTGYDYFAYNSRFSGYQWNEIGKVWFYTVGTPDLTPPETYIYVDGLYSFDGYYFPPVTVWLEAYDWDSGVQITEYSYNGVDWIEYFDSFDIYDEGTTTIYYRSTDFNGNIEDTKVEYIEIHSRPIDDPVVIFGMSSDVPGIDPHDAWDGISYSVIDQVVETLFAYDLSDPQMNIIPRLAADYGTWSPDGLTYTVPLRTGITFHDGTPFDAWAVQWNAYRLGYLMNLTGTLPPDQHVAYINSLYRHPDGTPIFIDVQVVDTYTVRYVLSKPFAAIEALLCFTGSGILSPNPTSTPFYNYLDLYSDTLVGTGPFIYGEYMPQKGIKYYSNEEYWQGPPAIKELWYLIIEDPYDLNQALLDGNIDITNNPLFDMIDALRADPEIIVEEGLGMISYYLMMNNNKVNQTIRQSISYAINYTYVVEEIYPGRYVRLESALPQGLRYADWTYSAAIYDVTIARQILVDAGLCNYDIYNDAEWIDAAINNPIASYNYAWRPDSLLSRELGNLLVENLQMVGIELVLEEMSWWEFIERILFDPNSLELYYWGWVADYNDPSAVINYLYSNEYTDYNFAQVNDPYLQSLIHQGMSELDPIAREAIYDEIQRYLVEELMPFAYLMLSKQFDAYNNKLAGYQSNPLDKVWFYGVYQPTVHIETPTGINVEVIDPIHGVTLIFSEVIESGVTTITKLETGPEIPLGYEINGFYFDITTTAVYIGPIDISFIYDENQVVGDEANLKIMHWNEVTELWEDATTWVDTVNNIIYGQVSSLSIFAILEILDLESPITTHSLSGTLGNEGWYITNVDITLIATDVFSGVSITEYSLNEIDWEEYLGTFTYSIEGETSIFYRSVDNVGNVEATNSISIKIDKTPPDTELIITDCYTDESGNIYVSYDSTFVVVGFDFHSGADYSYYRIDSGDWIIFEIPFNLTGPPGTYIIEYYSSDVAGNIEAVNSTLVILTTEVEEIFEGFGMLRVNGQRFVGSASLLISDQTIQMEIEDQIVTWDIVDYVEIHNMEIYTGEGELGRIKVIIIRCGDRTFVLAYGDNVFFSGYG
ncbi:MAG: ABC transporter substrate-binding protein [Candidatus Hermodarchaeota archaeon]